MHLPTLLGLGGFSAETPATVVNNPAVHPCPNAGEPAGLSRAAQTPHWRQARHLFPPFPAPGAQNMQPTPPEGMSLAARRREKLNADLQAIAGLRATCEACGGNRDNCMSGQGAKGEFRRLEGCNAFTPEGKVNVPAPKQIRQPWQSDAA